MSTRYGPGILLLLCCSVTANTVTDTFTVSAVIEGGCAFGNGEGSATTDFGTLDFGNASSLSSNIDVSSSSGAGSIVVTCTPGTAISIALDYGLNGGGTSAERYLINSAGTRTLGYQLYQDSTRSTVWGVGSLAYSVSSFPAATQTYTVYARLFATNSQPPAGVYTDTVTVTLTY